MPKKEKVSPRRKKDKIGSNKRTPDPHARDTWQHYTVAQVTGLTGQRTISFGRGLR
jgi:hypothetical protein